MYGLQSVFSRMPVWCFAIGLFLAMTGCAPNLSNTQTLKLEPNDIRSIIIESTPGEQTVLVTAQSNGVPISVHIHLEGDHEAVDRAITLGQSSDKVIASETDAANISLKAVIPGGREAVVRLQAGGSEAATVSLKITN